MSAPSLLIPDLGVGTEPVNDNNILSEAFVADDGAALGYLTLDAAPSRPNPADVHSAAGWRSAWSGQGSLTWHMMRRLKRASGELADREAQATP